VHSPKFSLLYDLSISTSTLLLLLDILLKGILSSVYEKYDHIYACLHKSDKLSRNGVIILCKFYQSIMVMHVWIDFFRKGVAPHLKSLMGPWWFFQFDPASEVAQAGWHSFEVRIMIIPLSGWRYCLQVIGNWSSIWILHSSSSGMIFCCKLKPTGLEELKPKVNQLQNIFPWCSSTN
jgi:hypothetical protein